MLERALVPLVIAVGVLALSSFTDGFRAITSEGARRVSVERTPRGLPPVALRDHRGEPFTWESLRGKPVLVEFIFTTCPDVCQRMSSDLGALVRAEIGRGDSDTHFVSVTFDNERDTTGQLAKVAAHYGADGRRWRFARIDDPGELQATLDAFGIVAIEHPEIRFEHNAAIHGIDRKGRLARIDDISATDAMAQWARAL